MTLAHVAAIPKRIAQAGPFSSLSHDDIHDIPVTAINAVIDYLNATSGSAAMPTGALVPFAGIVAPLGYLFARGQTVSQTTYANLYGVLGTVFNSGGEPGGTFRLPDLRGKTAMGCNPMDGQATGSYSTRTFGTVYGAEIYTNAAVAVSGNAPSATVNFSNMGSVTFPTFLAGAFPTLNSGAFPTFNAGSFQTLTSGTLPSVSGGTLPTLGAGVGAISSESKTGVTVTAAACLKVTVIPEAPDEAARCSGMVVDAFSVDITKANILGALDFNAGAFQSFSAGVFPSLTGGALPSSIGGTLPTLNSGTLPSSSGGTNTVSGAAATTAATALSGVTASISVPLLQPNLSLSMIIKT